MLQYYQFVLQIFSFILQSFTILILLPNLSTILIMTILFQSREVEVKKSESLPLQLHSSEDQLSFCEECSIKFEEEARFLRCRNNNGSVNTAVLPAWLQQYKKENQNSHNVSCIYNTKINSCLLPHFLLLRAVYV